MTTPPSAMPVVAILAGGQSRRMGRDKAAILWDGIPLLQRTVRVAEDAGCGVLVVGRERPADWPWPHISFVPDAQIGQGPLAGLVTALRLVQEPIIALACDMPLLTPEALHWLINQEQGAHGVAVKNGAQWEPLFSRYWPAALPLMERHLAEGRRSLQAILAAGSFQAAAAPPEIVPLLVNANTQEELQAIKKGSQTAPLETPPERLELPTL